MNKFRFPAAVFIFVFLSFVQSGHTENRTKFSVNPSALFVYNLQNFQLERTFFEGKLGWAFFYARTGQATREVGGYSAYGAEQSLTGKFYAKDVTQNSLWYGGKFSVASASVYEGQSPFFLSGSTATNVGTLGLLAMGGYQIVSGGLFIDPFAGVGLALTNNFFGGARYTGDLEETRLLLNFGVQIGMSF